MNIYDILLNFQDNYYEFFEWNSTDILTHIKKIYLMKISSNDYNNILFKKVVFDDDFLLGIFNKCEYFDGKGVLNIPYAIIFTDSYRAMGVMFDMDGNVLKYSSLELLDEEDVLDVSERIGICKINYHIIGEKRIDDDKTRDEVSMIKYIKNDLMESIKKKNLDKLMYLYYEYFGKESGDINQIKKDFINELESEINDKHYNLYNLIKLSHESRRV